MALLHDPDRKGAGISRRAAILIGAKFGVVGVLAWRMRELQVEQSERYRLLADENRINIRLIPPARGLIFDRTGTPLAANRPNYRIVMIREQAGDPEQALDELGRVITITDSQRGRVLKEVRQKSAFVPVTIAEHLDWDDFARVAANGPVLSGIIPEVGLTRYYPELDATAHVVGYVGPVSERDLKGERKPDPLLQIPRFQIGKTGVEQRMERELRGEAGISRIEVNSLGRVMRELDRTEGKSGRNIQLTLDLPLQRYALTRLAGESGSAVVLDIRDGSILALASTPSFDPNLFVFGISSTDWNQLLNDPYRPLYNKTVSGAYPPGSTFKMVVALAALEAGVVKPGETIWCPGFLQVGTSRFHCWRRGGHGHVDLRRSLRSSCDVFFYEMAQRVGIEKISEMAGRLGLGIKHSLPLQAVAEGLMPTKAWKERVHHAPWLIGDSVNAGIGQGYVLASPLQLAVMCARLASGKTIVPRLVQSLDGGPLTGPEPPDLEISKNHLRRVREGMNAVVNSRRGTAFSARIAEKSMSMAGKTGTSQVRQISEAERRAGLWRNEDLPWERRDHALFVAFAPVSDPRYAVSVVVEHGGSGSAAAAPIARDVLLYALNGGPAPLSAYPAKIRPEIRRRRATPEIAPRPPQRDRA